MNDNNNDVIEESVDYFLTTTTIRRSVALDRLVEILRLRKTNGDLCFHFNNGGIRRIELTERTATDDEQSDAIREILDMD